MPQQGAVRFAQTQALFGAFHIVGFFQVQSDRSVFVAGNNVGMIRRLGKETECESVARIFGAGMVKGTPSPISV